MQNGIATFEDNSAVSYKINHTLSTQSSNLIPSYLPKGTENLGLPKNLHMDFYNSCIHITRSWKHQDLLKQVNG